MKLAGKNIILTGASSGIGYEMLKLLQTYDNTRIIAVARNVDTIQAINNKVYPLAMDVSS